MVRDRPRRVKDDEEERADFWRGLARDLIIAAIIVAVFLGAIYAYTGVWPPLVVVESSSMQHADQESSFGVIDTGDMVFQQAAPTRGSVITYLEGRASGYTTYGDFGDVIIFSRPQSTTPVIHRAIMFVTLYPNGTADVPDLSRLTSGWDATNSVGPTTVPFFLRSVTIHGMGFHQDLSITFDFVTLGNRFGLRSGYVTMGDHNAYESPNGYDTGWVPRQEDIIGRARGEIPWFGLLKLTLQPTDSCCPRGWGSTGPDGAPKNSWDSLLVSLVILFALPFILEYASRGWAKYVSPRLPEIRWPWRRRKEKSEEESADPANGPKAPRKKPPKEGSSEP